MTTDITSTAQQETENQIAPGVAIPEVPHPPRSPINTAVVEYVSEHGNGRLSDRSLADNVLISGDRTTGRSVRAKIIAEDVLEGDGIQQGQLVTLSNCGSYGRLAQNPDGTPNGFVIHVVDRNTPNLNLAPEHGAAIGLQVATTGISVAIDLSGFEPEQAADFLAGFFSQIPKGKRKKMTIVVDDLDASIARRRNGVDSKALKDFYATIVRGPDMGISTVMVTRSPSEIPIETRNAMRTLIATRTTFRPHQQALAVVFDDGLMRYENINPIGIRFILDGQQWIRPMAERREDLPFYYPLRPLRTNAGTKDDILDTGASAPGLDFQRFITAVIKDGRKVAKQQKKAKPKSTKTATVKVQTAPTKTVEAKKTSIYVRRRKDGNEGSLGAAKEIAEQGGQTYILQRVALCTKLLGLKAGGMRIFDETDVTRTQIVDMASEQSVRETVAWSSANREPFQQLFAPTLLATVRHLLVEANADMAEDFLMCVLAGEDLEEGDPRLALRTRLLKKDDLPTNDFRRVATTIHAWNKHLAGEILKQARLHDTIPPISTVSTRPAGEVVRISLDRKAMRKAA